VPVKGKGGIDPKARFHDPSRAPVIDLRMKREWGMLIKQIQSASIDVEAAARVDEFMDLALERYEALISPTIDFQGRLLCLDEPDEISLDEPDEISLDEPDEIRLDDPDDLIVGQSDEGLHRNDTATGS
jgi:hypothetical protein